MEGSSWQTEDILITVRAAPNPSKKYTETSCVAGVRLRDMKPIRIYPVPARQLAQENRFTKYSVIRAEVQKSSDTRHESFKVNFESIREIDKIDTGPGRPPTWQRRNTLTEPFRIAGSIEGLRKLQDEYGIRDAPSLALIRPKRIKRFRIDAADATDWTPAQLAKLQQLGMFDTPGRPQLEFIPFRFAYQFECDDESCTGHNLRIVDWEVTESYRQWRQRYGEEGWRTAMQAKYWDDLVLTKDLQLYVGTIQAHPRTWTIIGLYYPPRQLQMPGLDV